MFYRPEIFSNAAITSDNQMKKIIGSEIGIYFAIPDDPIMLKLQLSLLRLIHSSKIKICHMHRLNPT